MSTPGKLQPGEGTTVGYIVEVNFGGAWFDVSTQVPKRNKAEADVLFRQLGSGGNLREVQETLTRRIVQPEPIYDENNPHPCHQ